MADFSVQIQGALLGLEASRLAGKPGARLSPEQQLLANKDFVQFAATHLASKNSALPTVLPKDQLQEIVRAFNVAHVFDGKSIKLAPQEIARIPGLSTHLLYKIYDLSFPHARLPVFISPFANNSRGSFLPAITTTFQNDQHFKNWVTAQYKKANPNITKILKDGTISRHDADLLIGMYKKEFPHSSLAPLPPPTAQYRFPVTSVSNIFPQIKVSGFLPPVSSKNTKLVYYFGSNGVLLDKSALDPSEKKTLKNIETLMHGGQLPQKEKASAMAAIRQIVPYVKPDSDLARFFLRYIRAEQIHRDSISKPNLSPAERHKVDLLSAQIKRDWSLLPKGTITASNNISREKFEMSEREAVPKTEAQNKLRQSFRSFIIGELAATNNYHLIDKIVNLPQETTPQGLIAELRKNSPKIAANLEKTLIRFDLASKYLDMTSRHGMNEQFNLQAAFQMLHRTPEELVLHVQGKPVADRAALNATRTLYQNPMEFYQIAEKFTADLDKSSASMGKLLVFTLQGVASAGAVASGNLWALPAIWLAPVGLSSITRAYVEDKGILEAAAKEWKINQIFGSPGNVLGEHLGGEKGVAWKLFLLDFVALGGVEMLATRGPAALRAFKLSSTELKAVRKIAEHRGISLTDRDIAALQKSLQNAAQNGTLKDVLGKAKLTLGGMSEKMQAFIKREMESAKPLPAPTPQKVGPHLPTVPKQTIAETYLDPFKNSFEWLNRLHVSNPAKTVTVDLGAEVKLALPNGKTVSAGRTARDGIEIFHCNEANFEKIAKAYHVNGTEAGGFRIPGTNRIVMKVPHTGSYDLFKSHVKGLLRNGHIVLSEVDAHLFEAARLHEIGHTAGMSEFQAYRKSFDHLLSTRVLKQAVTDKQIMQFIVSKFQHNPAELQASLLDYARQALRSESTLNQVRTFFSKSGNSFYLRNAAAVEHELIDELAARLPAHEAELLRTGYGNGHLRFDVRELRNGDYGQAQIVLRTPTGESFRLRWHTGLANGEAPVLRIEKTLRNGEVYELVDATVNPQCTQIAAQLATNPNRYPGIVSVDANRFWVKMSVNPGNNRINVGGVTNEQYRALSAGTHPVFVPKANSLNYAKTSLGIK